MLGGQACPELTAKVVIPQAQLEYGSSALPGGEGERVRNSPESPKGTGRAGDPAAGAGIPLQLPVKVWWGKYSLAACGQDHSRANPPTASVESPHRSIFIPKGCRQWEGPILEQGKSVRRKEQQRGVGD